MPLEFFSSGYKWLEIIALILLDSLHEFITQKLKSMPLPYFSSNGRSGGPLL